MNRGDKLLCFYTNVTFENIEFLAFCPNFFVCVNAALYNFLLNNIALLTVQLTHVAPRLLRSKRGQQPPLRSSASRRIAAFSNCPKSYFFYSNIEQVFYDYSNMISFLDAKINSKICVRIKMYKLKVVALITDRLLSGYAVHYNAAYKMTAPILKILNTTYAQTLINNMNYIYHLSSQCVKNRVHKSLQQSQSISTADIFVDKLHL